MPNYPGFDTQPYEGHGADTVGGQVVGTPTTLLSVTRSFGPLTFDSVLKEKHALEVELTGLPIEDGGLVADHAYVKQRELSLDVIVSDIYFGTGDLFSQNSSQTRSRNAWDFLKQLMKARLPIDVQTGLELYQNMVVTSAEAEQDVDTSRVLKVSITCKQAQFVTPVSVAFEKPPSYPASATSVPSATNTGDKPGKPVSGLKTIKNSVTS